MSSIAHTARPTHTARQARKATLGSWIGTTIEYYDFSVYGLAASLIFAKLFFPTGNAATGTLIALSTFGVAYLSRPVGAAIFGHLGDRLGRRKILLWTLALMGASTFVIGLLPTHGQIGIAAPILLVVCRLLQGISVGGEYSGAVLMSIEHSAERRRGLSGSIVNTGATAGLLLANLIFLPILALPDEQLLTWGWRIPFLLSAALVVVGFFIRRSVHESPDFEQAKQKAAVSKLPVLDVVRHHGRAVALVAIGILAAGLTYTMMSVFSLTYGEMGLGLDRSTMLSVLLPSTASLLITLPFFGWLGDRVGIRRTFLVSAAVMVVLPFLWFSLLDTRSYPLMVFGFILLLTGYAANYAVVPALFAQAFPPAVRYSGLSLGYTLGLIAGNAFGPTISTTILTETGTWTGVAVYMALIAAASFVAGIFLPGEERPTVQSGPEPLSALAKS